VGTATRGEGAAVYLPFGAFYRPGVPQRLLVHVTGLSSEPVTARYGFQLSPRMRDGAPGGSMRALGSELFVQCGDGRPPREGGCPAGDPLYYAQHGRPSREPMWELEWTPPAEAKGPITLYVAANAANGLGDQFGDRIFLNSLTVEPAGTLSVRQPFGGGGASPNGWVEIYGSGLPERDVRVSVGGKEATVGFAAAGQVNALLAKDTPLGLQILTVGEVSSPILVTATSPSLYPDPAVAGVGETAVLYATGCGALAGPEPAEVRMNHRAIEATAYASPEFPGLCQIQFVVPEVALNSFPVHVCMGGRCNGQRVVLTVGR